MVRLDDQEASEWASDELAEISEMLSNGEATVESLELVNNAGDFKRLEVSYLHPELGHTTVEFEFEKVRFQGV